jgi:hypothetical protein
MGRWAIDTLMVYLEEHLLMPTDDPELQWQVCKLLQPSSICRRMILAKEFSGTPLPSSAMSLSQK